MQTAIIIFVRHPELGKVKTRLAKDIGNEAALEVYKKLMLHTHNITSALNCHKYVFYADKIQENDLWGNENYRKKAQVGNDLGSRMQQAFENLFLLGYNKVIIIGSDCPGLNVDDIENAFERLQYNDVVLGPAEDGGYYLLGLTQPFPDLFTNKYWSTETVLTDTIADIEKSKKQFSLLEKLTDIDTVADLENYTYLLE